MAMFAALKDRSSFGGIIRLTLRFLQFVLALTVAGLYGVDLDNARKAHSYADGKWVYAEVVAGLSAISVFIYLIRFGWLFVWDFILFILWTALFGVFGKLYIGTGATPEQGGLIRMKHAVWVDLVNMLLWFITFIWGAVLFFTRMDKRTLHTGRAQV